MLLLLAPARAEPPPSSLLIHNVRVLDLDTGQVVDRPDTAILVEQGRIAAVGPLNQLAKPTGLKTIDGGGRVLMPGLADMHVHIWDRAALGAYLAHGITTVRNMSGLPFHLRLAREIAEGETPGPRLLTTGPILNSHGPNEQINHMFVETEADARAAVRAQFAAGYRHLKVYSNLNRAAYETIRHEARALGMSIVGHSPEGRRSEGMPMDRPFGIGFDELLDDGFVTFEHVETIVWHALRNRHDRSAMRALAKRMAEADAVVDPTLVAFYNLLRMAETRGAFASRPGMDLLNPLLVQQEQPNYERWAGEDIASNQQAFDFYKSATRMLQDAGVTLVAGSDAGIFANVPDVSLIDELELLVDAGLTPLEALRSATVNASAVVDGGRQSGRIVPGMRADLILLDADPQTRLRTLERPFAVVANGRHYDRARLDALLDQARTPDVVRTKRNLIEGLTAQGADPEVLSALR